jgi:MFS family permease
VPRPAALAIACASLILILAAAGAPAPLYIIYQQRFGISAAGLTGAFAIYILAAAAALLICGRLSDHIGRRSVSLLALACGIVGTASLATLAGLDVLLIGRAFQGLASGLAMSGVAAYVIDLDPPKHPGRHPLIATAVTSGGSTGGLALGAVLSGALVQFAPDPRTLIYIAFAGALALCALGVMFCPETSPGTPGALRSLRPSVRVPASVRETFIAACCCFIAAWALAGFYQALGPSIASSQLHHPSHLFAGLVVASLIGTSALAGPLTGRLDPRTAMIGGAGALAIATGAVLFALALRSTPGFLVASIAAGLAFGSAFHGGMRTLLANIRPAERAGLLAAAYLVSYFGAAIPAFLAGVMVPAWGLATVTRIYGVLVAILAVVAIGVLALPAQRSRVDLMARR